MGKLVRVGLASAVLALGCTNNYDDFGFPGGASGGASSGGAAGGGNASGAGGAAGTGNVSGNGGAGNAGGTAGAGNASGAGGTGNACGPCPTGMVCNNTRCECTAAAQCGSGQAIDCNGDGRCVCDGNSCRPGETCSTNGANPSCSCNGGKGCDSGETCCASGCARLDSDEANCGACGHACAAGQQCSDGKCGN